MSSFEESRLAVCITIKIQITTKGKKMKEMKILLPGGERGKGDGGSFH
jgi:hypothetical protein